ncbi:hypothetical protein FVF58_43750 [Paraburkholderia panacisoli]|uniref:Phosphoadenosine phosphosulfate reductase family protein n=1 Tax=Paraburkholderia panacisoli TaxID=2603818 RepID=A0A5B0G9E2_9BURK|nr:hypothetical protein [Paraburkholderia panacisoli]KAA0998640.1 hypothetical protein FVF58_43750 [Paraburkholderia panacisoli]
MERGIFILMERAIASMQSYIERGYILATGLSGGKDSTCAMVLMLEAVRRSSQTKPDGSIKSPKHRRVHIIREVIDRHSEQLARCHCGGRRRVNSQFRE